MFDVSCFTVTPCCDSYEVARSSNTIGVQLQIIQYIFQIKIWSKDTPSFQRRDWLKNERYSEVELRCSMSKTKYGECEWDGIWSVKWMRWMRWKWLGKYVTAYTFNEQSRYHARTGFGNPTLNLVFLFVNISWFSERFGHEMQAADDRSCLCDTLK